ncbi:MAG: hypothetical protein C4K58_03950 [Flavobacteriaceae bacterium]|nr:MAG: hypothetical protein C4K58_03950 [Flavobacteriaceae bacterium]
MSVYDLNDNFENEFVIKKISGTTENVIFFDKDISSEYRIHYKNGKIIKSIQLYPNRKYSLRSVNSHVVITFEFKTDSFGNLIQN